MIRLVPFLLLGCGPAYWRGPVERVHEPPVEERIGAEATIEIRLGWKMPAQPETRPAWLGSPGAASSPELLRDYAPGAFHNGHLPAFVNIPKTLARGVIELEGCPPISAAARTGKEIAAEVERCAAQFVESPHASIFVVSNPGWSIDVIVHGRRRTVPLRSGDTLISAVARSVHIDVARHQRISLSVVGMNHARRIDLMAIARGEQPDIPLRVGDTIVIE